MLQVYITGTNESGFLELDPATALDMESLHDAFDDEFSMGEFSIPIDVPFTNKNIRLLNQANRIVNNAVQKPFFPAIVYDDGFMEIPKAKATIINKTGSFNSPSGKFSISVSGTKGLFGSLIYNKKLADVHYGNAITYTETSSRDFATAVMKGSYPQYDYLAFAPVAMEDFFDNNRPDYDGEFLAGGAVNNIVVTGSGPNDWQFARPSSSDPDLPVTSGNAEFIDFRTVPFLQLKFVLKKLFAHFGYTVTGALITDNYFDAAYVFNTWSIDVLSAYLYTDSNKTIYLKNHVPDMLVKDFLKSVFSFFKVYMAFNGSIVILKYKKQLLSNRRPVAFSAYCSPLYETETREESEEGFTIAYGNTGNDSFYSDRVKELTDKTLVATVISRADLDTLDIGRDFTIADIALVKNENLYYCVADATSIPVTWDCFAENLSAYVSGAGERNADAGASTLCQYVQYNGTSGLYERMNYVGARLAGNYINKKGVRVKNPVNNLRLFYIAKTPVSGVNIPVSFNHNTTPGGTKLVPYSLALNAGFAETFHLAWENLLSRMEQVKFSVNSNKKVLSQYNNADCLEINSVQFIPYKTERTIPALDDFEAYLVPL